MSKLLIIAILSIGSLSIACEYNQAIKTIENYTGEKYQAGDCENKDIYESDDESVVAACDIVEGD